MFVWGVTGVTGKFYGTMTVLSSHEDADAWSEVYQFVHNYGAHFDIHVHRRQSYSDVTPDLGRHWVAQDESPSGMMFYSLL